MKLTRKNLIKLANFDGFCSEGRKSLLRSLNTNRTLKQIFDARMKRSVGQVSAFGAYDHFHTDSNFNYLICIVRNMSSDRYGERAKTFEKFKEQFESIKL